MTTQHTRVHLRINRQAVNVNVNVLCDRVRERLGRRPA